MGISSSGRRKSIVKGLWVAGHCVTSMPRVPVHPFTGSVEGPAGCGPIETSLPVAAAAALFFSDGLCPI